MAKVRVAGTVSRGLAIAVQRIAEEHKLPLSKALERLLAYAVEAYRSGELKLKQPP